MNSIPQQFFKIAKEHPSKDFLAVKSDNKWQGISYKKTAESVEFFSRGLLSLGLNKGNRVAILSENRPAWAIADLGIMTAGGVSVPIHATLSSAKIEYILKDSEAKFLFIAGHDNFLKFSKIEPRPKALEKIIYLDLETFEKSAGMIDFNELLKQGQNFQISEFPSLTLASLVYTSGTTGEPKGVILSHRNFLSNIQSAIKAVPIMSSDIFLSFLPLSHVLERTAGYYIPMSVGATIYYAENVKKLSDNLKEVKPTVLICVPRIFEKVYEKIVNKAKQEKGFKKKLFFQALKVQSEVNQARREARQVNWFTKIKAGLLDKFVCQKVRQALGGNLRFAVSGGASLSKQIARFFEDLGLKIIEGYGLTETAPIVTVNRLEKYKFGTVGLPLEGVEVRISSDKEILVRGDNVMSGYWHKSEATREALAADGWFCTGDLGFLDGEGFLSIIGRKKEIIVTSGGKNVSPEPIENALQLSKYINQAMIIGNSRKFISCLITPDFEKLKGLAQEKGLDYLTKEELIQQDSIRHLFEKEIEKQLSDFADFEKVKKFILLPCEFTQENEELTPTLKLRRAVIGEKYKKEIDRMYL